MTLIVGLIWTFGFATLAIGTLNLVSIAFAVMFIGLSIDFGIQFGVRYGQERFIADDGTALPRTGRFMATSPSPPSSPSASCRSRRPTIAACRSSA
ncbi:MAG: hypothetical protein R3D05_18200 [Dongiaceae bacterium]